MAQKTGAQLQQDITQFITDNANNEITGGQLRGILTDLVDSLAKYEDDSYRLGLIELDPTRDYPTPVAFVYNDAIYFSSAGHSAGENPDTPGSATFIEIGGGGGTAFDGNRPITRQGDLYGLTIGGSTLKDFVENQWFIPEGPGHTLTGGLVLEPGDSTSRSVTFSFTKKTYGITFVEMVKSGSVTFFDTPTIPADMDEDSDTQRTEIQVLGVTIEGPSVGPFNQEFVTFTGTVRDNQNNQKQASTTFTYRHMVYAGVLASDDNAGGNTYTTLADVIANPPTDDGVKSLANQELSNTKSRTYQSIGGGGFTVFAWPSIFGTPTFNVNGLANNGFTKVRTNSQLLNQFGYSTAYDVYVMDAFQNGSSTVQII